MDLVARLGIKPAMTAGHSYGEYAALHCAGVLSREDFFTLSATRGRVMAAACAASEGAMAAVQMAKEELLVQIKGVDKVLIANHNAPLQAVISGEKQQVQQVVDSLNATGVLARMLPVAGAFHSALVSSAQTAMAAPINAAKIQPPQIPVYANATARPYDTEATAIRQQLSEHILSAVNFVGQINNMYSSGARVFIELGPKSVLTNLVSQTLAGKKFTAVSLDGQSGGLRGFLIALGSLINCGVKMQLTALYEGRDVKSLDLSRLVELTSQPTLPKTTWLVNGGSVRPSDAAVGYSGKEPPLNWETAVQKNSQSLPTQLTVTTNSEITPRTIVEEYSHNSLTASEIVPKNVVKEATDMELFGTATVAHADIGNGAVIAEFSTPNLTSVPVASRLVSQSSEKSNGNQPVVNGNAIQTPLERTLQNNSVFMSTNSLTSNTVSLPTEVAGLSTTEATALQAYQSYQKTMQQFLSLQEQVMDRFLNCIQSNPTIHPVATATPNTSLITHNGNGHSQHNGKNGHSQHNGHSETLATVIASKPVNDSEVKTSSNPEPIATVPALEVPPVQLNTAPVNLSVAVTTNAQVTTISPASERASLTQTLVQLVSNRTGYPPEMLGLDQDLEAELGIDSIKRVEILGALQKSLPQPLATTVQQQMESLTRMKSLNKIVEQLLQGEPVVSASVNSQANSLLESKKLNSNLSAIGERSHRLPTRNARTRPGFRSRTRH